MVVQSVAGADVITRMMYDTMSQLVGESKYPDNWWHERQHCFNSISPTLIDTLDLAWQGMIDYWDMRGLEYDGWLECNSSEKEYMEKNCTIQPIVEMAIWEPCNYVSNLAYDRLVLEICNQNDWTLEEMDVSKIAQAYALITFGSAFFHGSETRLGMLQDNISNNLFTYILHQASMKNIPYDPILHDLSVTPRTMTSEEIVDYWLDMFDTVNVAEWNETLHQVDLPSLQFTFSGIFTHIMLLDFGYNSTVAVALPFMDLLGVDDEMRNFIFGQYLPLLDEKIGHIELSLLEKAELFENTIGTVIKLLYGFVWQEEVIDFGGLNMTPEANAAGAAFTPKLNAFGNNLTRWDLTVEDVQMGGGYPGSAGCNDVIPHAKWHAQSAASLSDMTKLVDFVLKLENKHM